MKTFENGSTRLKASQNQPYRRGRSKEIIKMLLDDLKHLQASSSVHQLDRDEGEMVIKTEPEEYKQLEPQAESTGKHVSYIVSDNGFSVCVSAYVYSC